MASWSTFIFKSVKENMGFSNQNDQLSNSEF